MGTVQVFSADDEDYIDMEVSSSYSSNYLCYSSISSPPQTREFEFQLISSSVSQDKEATTSPADDLFYKGKLLPLHLPPRLQMVRKLLHNSEEQQPFEDNPSTPFVNTSESCRVSTEINPDDYLFEWSSTEMSALINADHNLPKKSWTKKLKQIKQYSVLSQKLKASRAYLKSLFIKSGCSDESSARDKDCLNKCMKVPEKNPSGKSDNIDRFKLVSSFDREIVEDVTTAIQRRSFSGAIQWHSSTTKSSLSSSSSTTSSGSSSFSFSSTGIVDVHLLKSSSSANSEIEGSIEGAIAHCKNSLSNVFPVSKTEG
ncbi:hypothetical protein HS088_TW13G00017 [Tripterygium wilfordii]|uniref:Membrane-associated kinase regulator 4 n=1 Tax=Tripterygium wilfordii TaxID=458696 RepID=A0A7J7CT43_TRIWF|nr:probable membrane-associated kinase regulator 3 [Tripterygium wilfordii]KAF5737139.1 hypothetical protein HS088_TW13G00017 [Tripterygium wilfordii]